MLRLGISPCPNDTFIFDTLINATKFQEKYQWQVILEDVETLNQWALEERLDVTKVSFATYLQVQDQYDLLISGSALGHGVGPLLVSKKKVALDQLSTLSVAIPGKFTTANLLLTEALPNITNKKEVIFSKIEQQVLEGSIDLGLIIHESRFTYASKGLKKVIDLGAWWEDAHGLPIPLGCIIIRKSLSRQWKAMIESDIQESLKESWSNYPNLSPYVKEHAQEMDEKVMRQHIELYVNEETMCLSSKGLKAVQKLQSIKIE